jgi:hypothetical protein
MEDFYCEPGGTEREREIAQRFDGEDLFPMAAQWRDERDIEQFGELFAQEYGISYTPTHEAKLVRGGERMYVSAYGNLSRVYIVAARNKSGAGAIREIPVGWRDMESARTFRLYFEACVKSYRMMGWTLEYRYDL